MLLRQSPEIVSLMSVQVLVGDKYKINCYIKHNFLTMGQHKIQSIGKKRLILLKVSNTKLQFH